jgi:hypothetical protein
VTADWPGGVRHVGDVSPVCCSCTERGKACPDTAVRVVKADGEREPAKRLNRKAVSTVAGRAGGPARSSYEASAGRGGGEALWAGSSVVVFRSINRERVFPGGVAWTS